ncbi:type II toxin-antitoxin system ParD family antitoxin [Erwinia sp. E602]|uniref:type II toxin-antitoxin system ParD family antitoxin n=1 Tax=Erwinia sp. E602 TaxID=2675378 RepID=UPI001BAC06AC|nr:type II toxin-antitoxin system ParD family antitoxin [Erwinia sp. E602]QUG73872.1 type II toxin-antitoxin system ParD family antitoxin [Erwinia sp. E602]
MPRTMTVDLGEELRGYVESLVESGDYRTQSEVIRESLRLLKEQQAHSKLQQLRTLIDEGLASGAPQEWDRDAFIREVKGKLNVSGKED